MIPCLLVLVMCGRLRLHLAVNAAFFGCVRCVCVAFACHLLDVTTCDSAVATRCFGVHARVSGPCITIISRV